MGMRERARHLGGHLDIRSAPGEGTRMVLNLELQIHMQQALEDNLTLNISCDIGVEAAH
jgi:signal transduction histidine kinase